MHSALHRVSLLVALALVISLAAATVIVPGPAGAAPVSSTPWSSYTSLIGGSGTLANETPAVVADHAGNIYVFYFRMDPGAVWNLYVVKYQDEGTAGALTPAAGFPVRVNTVTNNVFPGNVGIWAPAAAIDSAGNVYAAWATNALNVFVSKSTDGGLTWSAQSQANPASLAGDVFAPSLALAPDGRVYVAWVDEVLRGSNYFYNISVTYSTDGGSTFGAYQNVSANSPANWWVSTPDIAVDSHNRVHVVYAQYTFSGASPSWVNYTYSDGGVVWSAPVTLNGGLYGLNPQIAVDAQDVLHVAWVDTRTGVYGNPLIYYRSSSDRGATWTAEVPISTGLWAAPINYYTTIVRIAVEGDTVMVVWDTNTPGTAMNSVVSSNGGGTWTQEQVHVTGGVSSYLAADGNGTFYAFSTDEGTTPHSIGAMWWHAPPSHPTITSVTPGAGSLAVAWTASPENDVVTYQVWRSSDGSTYSLVASVDAGTTSYTDTGLANGTYWYQIDPVDAFGYVGNPSPSAMGTVGPSVAQLQAEITALQNVLNSANADLGAIQTRLDNLKSQLTAVQGNTTALQNEINNLQNQINAMQGQQATQTMSYANLAFEIIVVVLLVVLLLNQMRKPKSPQLMMAQPAQAEPRKPEDDL